MIHLLPGTGADRRMYPAPWTELPGANFIDWPAYRGETTLAEIATSVAALHPIVPDDWLVGSSLGGMVALEIAWSVPVRGVILVGSAVAPTEINRLLQTLFPLINLTPLVFIQQLTGKWPTELTRMFQDSDPDFIRAMCKAIMTWPGAGPLLAGMKVHRLHGRRDLVIPCPAQGIDRVIDGGHVIAMSHAAECVDFVRRVVGA